MHQVYYAKIKPLTREERYKLYYNCLPESRQKRVDNYISQEDKIRSVAAFSLLIKLLNDNHISYQNEDFKIDANGKLYLANSNIYLNLSHSMDFVIAGISDHPIGVDVEYIKKDKKYEDIAERVFNQEEIIEYRRNINKRMFFYQVWTIKESYIKCIGKGLQVDMRSINISSPEFKNYYFKLFFLKNHQFAICLNNEPVANIKEIKL